MSASESKSEIEEFIDDREVARILCVSRSWCQQRRARGEGPPFHRLGGRLVRYRKSEVVAWAVEKGAR